MVCCYNTIGKCILKLAAWLGHHMEIVMLHEICTNRCHICIAPPDEFGEVRETPHEIRQHSSYAFAYHTSDVKPLESDRVENINDALWHILNCLPHELVLPDTLNTLLLCMLVHLMKWLQEFLGHIGHINQFDYLWSRLTPYSGFTRPNKEYRSVTH